MSTHEEDETTQYAMRGALVLVVGVALLILDGQAPKAARWGVGLLALYVTLRSLQKSR